MIRTTDDDPRVRPAQGTEDAVREVMRLVLGPGVPGTGDVVRSETDGWDSLKHVELLFSLEDALDVSLDGAALGDLDSLSAICAAIGPAPESR